MTETKDDTLLTPGEAAEYLGVSKRTLAGWRGTRTGPDYYQINPRVIRYDKAKLAHWLNHNEITS